MTVEAEVQKTKYSLEDQQEIQEMADRLDHHANKSIELLEAYAQELEAEGLLEDDEPED